MTVGKILIFVAKRAYREEKEKISEYTYEFIATYYQCGIIIIKKTFLISKTLISRKTFSVLEVNL